jgi:transcriptional accessory protein Tex/SPT6
VLKAIDEQGKLTDALRLAIASAPTKQELEDIYLPFKQKRRTKGQIAKEFGIEPLADKLFADPTLDPHKEAEAFCKRRWTTASPARLQHHLCRAGRRARHPVRALGRGPGAGAEAARMAVG